MRHQNGCGLSGADVRPLRSVLPVLLFVLFLPLLLLSPSQSAAVDLVINEFQAINVTTVTDEFGQFEDWVEIHNFGTVPINVEGMFLTDDLSRVDRFEFPDTLIQPGGYLVVWCDGQPEQGPLHANLNLDGDGEELGLFDTLFEGQATIDTFVFGPQMTDVSMGRFPNGTGPFAYLGSPSPGTVNNPPFDLPPLLVGVGHSPTEPTDLDEVQITVQIIDDFGLAEVLVFFDSGAGFSSVPMADDGTNGDGDANDGVWGATLAPMPDGPVHYYISAEDQSGLITLNPVGAPIVFYTYFVGYNPPALSINEFLASNSTTNTDEANEFDDWVEIYNGSDEDVSLFGMHLSDNLLEPTRFQFPDVVVPAGGFILVWCDDETGQGELHAPFKLSAGGEEIGLFDTALHGVIPIDSYVFGPQSTDVSEGRSADGGETWIFFEVPTPGASNDASASVPPLGSFAPEVRLLTNPSVRVSRFQFDLARPAPVRFSVFSVTGRELTRLLDRELAPGSYDVSWSGADSDGGGSPAGVYLYRLDVGPLHRSGTFVRSR